MKKILLLGAVALIAGSTVFFRIRSIESRETEKPKGIETIQQEQGFPVALTDLQKGNFDVWREIPGKVEGYCEAFITTPDPARVAAINYRVGDFVKADTPIISLDENDPNNRSKIKLLRSVYEDALKEYESYKSLYESGGISEGVLDKFSLKLKQAKTDLDAARATVHLTSPFNGTLVAVYPRVGENADPQKTLAIVSSLDKVRIIAHVSDRDVAECERGQPVNVPSPSGAVLSGNVDRLSIAANPATGLFDLEMVVANPENQLKAGTYVTAEVRIFHKDQGTFIDSRCILRDFDGQDYMYQIKDNLAVKSNVHVLFTNSQFTLLKEGIPLLPVVRDGQSQLKDGVKVAVLPPREASKS